MLSLSDIKYSAFVFLVVVAVYMPACRFGFVRYDDHDYIGGNQHMRDGLTAQNCKWALTSCGYASNWHPMAWASLMADVSADRALRGGARTGDDEWENPDSRLSHIVHAHNIMLHAANASLLFLLSVMIARCACGEGAPEAVGNAFCAGMGILTLLWAVHPLRNEVVCWASERKELSCVFFLLLTLVFYIDSKARSWRFLAAVAYFALALMSKPVAVTLPAVLLAWDWIVRGKVKWLRLVPFAAMSVAASFLTLVSQTEAMEVGAGLSSASRVASILHAPVVYIAQTLWPVDLAIMYPYTVSLASVKTLFGALLMVAMAAVCLRWLAARTTWSGVGAFAVAWVYVGLVPMTGFVKVGIMEHQDRYTYWISCGIIASISLAAGRLLPLLPKARERLAALNGGRDEWRQIVCIALLVGMVPVLALVALTRSDMQRWRGSIPLLTSAISKFPTMELGEVLAKEFQRIGRDDEAERWLRFNALQIRSARTLLMLADFLLKSPPSEIDRMLGRPPYSEAEQLVAEALEMEPGNEHAIEVGKAIEEYRKGVK